MSLGSIAASAMNAFSVDMMARANNIANVSTAGFQPHSVTLATGADGLGVRVASISRDTRAEASAMNAISPTVDGVSPESMAYSSVNASGTDLAREFAGMISTHHAYAANAAVVRAYGDMSGAVIDMLV